ncbi:MAG TPA: sulfate reduction electron transfer complex DsrMKJOP subunit DsrM [Syntrophorhabdales bacterium]|nr:sulfate reduction electron transfer complex DsrMKJOP subunit DsrM [Syntrophorhabdales bacterium]
MNGMCVALLAVLILVAIPWIGVGMAGLTTLFGAVVPYVACVMFVVGFIYRVAKWAQSPVPFHIPTVCGQQKSLPWIKANNLESPQSSGEVFARMALEVLFFRSLFRNDRTELKTPQKLIYSSNRFLWAGGMLFHWSLLIILFRHLRFFTEPVLPGIALLQSLDGLFYVGLPTFYLTDAAILLALTYLFFRRITYPQVRLISLPSDYFALLLIIAVVLSGVLMRHFFKIDAEKTKELILGLVSLRPAVPQNLGLAFYIHLFLVSVLAAFFPFSKLMHAPGVFLSPTRNLQNNSRSRRHVNPWAYPVKVHTYQEYEDEFGAAMKEAGLPVEKQ